MNWKKLPAMEYKWIRPAAQPVTPNEINELSSRAVKVLCALRRTFQPQSRCQANSQYTTGPLHPEHESLRFYGTSRRHSELDAPKQNFYGEGVHTHRVPDAIAIDAFPSELFARDVEALPSSSSKHDSPLFSELTPRPIYALSPKIPTPSIINEDFISSTLAQNVDNGMENSWDEISSVVDLDVPKHESFFSFASLEGLEKNHSTSSFRGSSPVSEDEAVQTQPASHKRQSSLAWNGRDSLSGITYTTPEHMASNALPNLHDSLTLSAVATGDMGSCHDHSFLDSVTFSNHTTSSKSDESLLSGQDQKYVSRKNSTLQEFPESIDNSYKTKGNLKDRHPYTGSALQDLRASNSKPLQPQQDIQQVVDVVCISAAPQGGNDTSDMSSNFSFGDNSNDFSKSSLKNYTVGSLKQSIQDEELPTPNSERKKKTKFLGTPFKRALSSTNISINDHSDENNGTSNYSEARSEIREPLKSRDDNVKDLFPKPSLETDFVRKNNLVCETTDEICERTPNEAMKLNHFPIFKANNEARCKSVLDTKSRVGPPLVCKKKMKFTVPYKGIVGYFIKDAKIQDLAAVLTKEVAKKEAIQKLNEKLATELSEKLNQTSPEETSFTLQYRGGFCQLNRPEKSDSSPPETAVLRIKWPTGISCISVPLQMNSWSHKFLRRLFSDKSRKVCFKAQEAIKHLVEKFSFPESEVVSQWMILDPLIGCWLLNPDEPPQSFRDVLKYLKIFEEQSGLEMLLKILSQCAQTLYETLEKKKMWKLFLHIEMRVTPILACMELHGIQVDVKKLQEMAVSLKDRLIDIQKAAHIAAGKQFQLTSPQQLGAILYGDLKLDTKHNIDVKETGKRQSKSTSESMLVRFKDLHPLPGIMLDFRGLHKLKSSYVDVYLGYVSDGQTCRIYTTWDQISAATGRITSNEPNLQTIPKQRFLSDLSLRSAFVARDNYSLLAADFQHIELRVFAHLSKDSALIDAFNQTSDIFVVLSKKWFPKGDPFEVNEEEREKTKRIVYALMYGAGPSKLMEILQVEFNQATKIIQTFSSTFPKLQDFRKDTIQKCRQQGYLATETGRHRLFPEIKNSNPKIRMHCERQAVNFLIQGTAADLCKCAMVHAQRHMAALSSAKSSPVAHLLLQIHDELLWEVMDSDLTEVTGVIQEAMEEAASVLQCLSSFSVPLPVVMKVGKTWADMKVVRNNVLLGTLSQQA